MIIIFVIIIFIILSQDLNVTAETRVIDNTADNIMLIAHNCSLNIIREITFPLLVLRVNIFCY